MAKAVLVGAGSMGRAWAKNIAGCDGAELAGWVDIRPDAARQAADELGLAVGQTGDDLEAALSSVRPDFVVDVTVPEAHHGVTLTSLRAGVPVLGEKPMASTMDEAREMVAASEKAGCLYMVSQSRRYDGRLHAFRRLIEAQTGGVGILNADFFLGPHFGGFRDEMASPLLLDMAIHTFDQARYLSGGDPVSVYCEEFNPPWSWYKGDACATALFEMTGGLRFSYRGSWCAEGRATSWEGEWRAVGPQGTATWDGSSAPMADVVTGTKGFMSETEARAADVDAELASGIAGSLRDFLGALQGGGTPMGECHDNIKSLAMVFAAVESARTGQRVSVRVERAS